MLPWTIDWKGRLQAHVIESEVLKGNPLGDPHQRPIWIYTPPGYESDPERRYPVVVVIQGYSGQLDMWRNRSPWRLTYPELADRLFASGEAPPAILAFADCWTALGGSQFLDSPATGRYHTYLCEEVVPWIDSHFRTLASAAHRGIQGKSSGGYGAMVTAMLRPDLFGGLATHAGDALFELSYLADFAPTVRALQDSYGGSWDAFWKDHRSRVPGTRGTDHLLVSTYAMAACYSANEDGSIEFPFDLETAQLRPEVWDRWLAWDPVRMAPGRADALRKMRAIYIDAGRRDEYYLDLGAIAFRHELERLGASEVFFELFDAAHGAIEYRYPIALKYLAEALT